MNKVAYIKSYKWIILIHQIPSKYTSIRVKVWRRLQKIRALSIKNSVYVLPFTKETYEDFQWIRQEIIAKNGDATIFKADSIEGINDQNIIKQFQRIRNKDYNEIAFKILKLKKNIEGSIKKSQISTLKKETFATKLKKLKTELNEVVSLDYFHASDKKKAESAITNCNKIIEGIKVYQEKTQLVERVRTIKIYNKNAFQKKRWITRKGLHIDRISSGWLIRKFIDKEAKFSFVEEDITVENGIGFDIYNAEFSHRGDDCTFETLIKSFNLKDPVLVEIAQIVHDIDLKDDKFGRSEAEGVNQIIIGLSQKLKNDKKLLESGMEIFDSLYQYYSSKKQKRW